MEILCNAETCARGYVLILASEAETAASTSKLDDLGTGMSKAVMNIE